jgi:hypothetical protein
MLTEPVLRQVDPPAPAAEEPGDSWEDKADMSSAATTPDDEDNSMEDDSGECTDRQCHALYSPFLPLSPLIHLSPALSTDYEDEKGF